MTSRESAAPGFERLALPQVDDLPLQHLLRVLSLTRVSEESFTGVSLPHFNGRIFGGQVMAQALVAAGATVDGELAGRQPHSMHGYFLRPGDVALPLEFVVERLHDGRSFSTRRVHALQQGRPILAFNFSFQLDQPGLDHQIDAGAVPLPDALPETELDLLRSPNRLVRRLAQAGAFEIRRIDPPIYEEPDPNRPDRQRLWLHARSPLRDGAPQLLHRALLAFAADSVMLEPVLRRHGVSWFTEGISVASLDHSMWWHRPVDVRDWLLFSQETASAQNGRGLGMARVHALDGTLVASIAQEGMVRVPAAGH